MKKGLLIIVLFLIIIIFTNEVLVLKNGKIINGKIIKMDEDTMTIYSKNGEYILDREDIKIIYLNEEEYKKAIGKTKVTKIKKETAASIEMVFVEGGTFVMGDTWGDGIDDEQPVHEVTLDDFWIGKYEVTQKEWEEVMGTNTSRVIGENLAIVDITWYDAIEFCNKKSLNEGLKPAYMINKEKKDINNKLDIDRDKLKWTIKVDWDANGYRLPTEAEWEYAARGGNKSKGYKYSGSNNIDEIAWYNRTSGYQRPLEVGKKMPNELGLYDMSGNAWEWCWDWFGYYHRKNQKNPRGPISGKEHIIRGGSWFDGEELCRIVNRHYTRAFTKRLFFFGFRVVRSKK